MERRDPYDLGDTLGALVGQHDLATGATAPAPAGARGPRCRPRYPSEDQRERLTIDVDMEPAVGALLQRLALTPPAVYGQGPVRPGDLAAAALLSGLLQFHLGQLQVEAEWTVHSRGQRRLALVQDLEALWDTTLQAFEIDRLDPAPTPLTDRQQTASRPPAHSADGPPAHFSERSRK